MLVERYFTVDGEDPLESVKFERRDVKIRDSSGKIIFSFRGAELPSGWSALAGEIAVSKYFRKSGVPKTKSEKSVRQLIRRVTGSIAAAGLRQRIFKSRREARLFERELGYLLVHQRAAFNSPVWFNVGLYENYGIKGGRGQFAWDPTKKRVVEQAYAYVRPQSSACFIQSVEDDLLSIFDLLKNEAKLFKYGSGSGTNFSVIRGRTETLSGGGHSSGLLSFLEVFDKAASATKSGGTTRRAAKMVCLDADHPEILDFIDWKWREEEKAKALIREGYSSGLDGEAYRSVSGQNANLSVRLPDAFFREWEKNGSWRTRLRTNGKTHQIIPARSLFRTVAQAAWKCADPGIQFHDTVNRWHTCPASGEIRASNPCSEYMFLDDSSCNLASLNLLSFLHGDGSFDIDSFRHAVRVLVVAQEILVSYSSYPTEKIARNSYEYRPIGLGYANLGALLMSLALPYDSDEARAWCSGLTALMHGEAASVSADLAKRIGPFSAYRKNRGHMLRVMGKHLSHARKLPKMIPDELRAAAVKSMKNAVESGRRYGYRNSQFTVLAPTGTIALLMDCDTTGIEPDFALVKYKKLYGGGELKIVNHSVPRALSRLGYSDDTVARIKEYLRENECLDECPLIKTEHLPIFDCAVPCGKSGMRFLRAESHLLMMAAAQPFISGAISKTVNLPQNVDVDEVEKIFLDAWKLGLKAVSVYREGSKLVQPLSGKKEPAAGAAPEETPRCPICGHPTVLRSGCYICENCGHALSCG